MMGELIARNLLHRPMRTFIGVMAVAVEVALVVLIVGLTSGLLSETAKRIEGIGADVMVQPPAASVFLGFSGAPMPIKIAAMLKKQKYVQSIAPALLQFNSAGGVEVVYGIDRESFHAVSGGFVFIQGHDMEGPDDLLVDDWAAKAKKIKVGDTYNLLNHDWHVAGIIEHGKGARLFVPLATLQDLVGAHDKASIFLLRCTRPEHTEDVIQELRHVLPGYTIRPLKEFLSLMTSTNIPGLQTFIHAMIGLAVAIGLLVIFLTMYTTVIERTRDIGVLKSLGADRSFIIRALLSESTALCIIGIAAGVGLAYVVRAAFLAGFPTLSILITPAWILRAAGIALAGAILGAIYPAWLASRKDPVEALSYD
ncbi:MAG TPA: FtsX-like permease family protein [Candidatus Acidoferrales bacterium]|jgi:putative ABC transport system permease protein|nr:FtsX-like permease family protein [Candidatus Acidoferrales bacterium]